jgi:hypothetical protein
MGVPILSRIRIGCRCGPESGTPTYFRSQSEWYLRFRNFLSECTSLERLTIMSPDAYPSSVRSEGEIVSSPSITEIYTTISSYGPKPYQIFSCPELQRMRVSGWHGRDSLLLSEVILNMLPLESDRQQIRQFSFDISIFYGGAALNNWNQSATGLTLLPAIDTVTVDVSLYLKFSLWRSGDTSVVRWIDRVIRHLVRAASDPLSDLDPILTFDL